MSFGERQFPVRASGYPNLSERVEEGNLFYSAVGSEVGGCACRPSCDRTRQPVRGVRLCESPHLISHTRPR